MSAFVLTQYDGAILGPIAKLLGVIMNAIYNFLEVVGIPNVGLAIILFTIVIYLEGDDPDCIDSLIGGEMKMHMDITEEHI